MKTILVTGGSGFIGSHLCEKLLESGRRVINLDNFNDFYAPSIKRKNIRKALLYPTYTLIEGDIRNASLMDGIISSSQPECIIHLAALAGVRKSLETPQEYIDVNIKGTLNLLDAISRQKGPKCKLLFASSSSVYGSNDTPFRETDAPVLQKSPYATTKFAGEQFCKTYNNLYSIPVTILRFFNVYGPRQRPEMAIHNFTRLIHEGNEIPVYGDGKSSRDYTYIDDIVNGITAVIDLDCSFEIFNLGNSNPVKLNQLIEIIELKLGKPALKRFLPSQKGEVSITCADIKKAEIMLGYLPKVGIEEGIERFIDWFVNPF